MDYGKKDPFRTKSNRNMANKRNMLVSHKGRKQSWETFHQTLFACEYQLFYRVFFKQYQMLMVWGSQGT